MELGVSEDSTRAIEPAFHMWLALIFFPAVPGSVDPVEVFMKGDNVTADERFYYCFRIPQLLALPTGTLLAFAEGRADGCKPDVRGNRPIVVRASRDEGKTWGDIRIAGPALPSLGTNYPGAFARADGTVVLRYLVSNGSVFSTTSHDEGTTWSPPVEASQPPGVRCGSMWPAALGSSVVLPCGGNASALSHDGGRTWTASSTAVALDPNVTGLGEVQLSADGRSPSSLCAIAGHFPGYLGRGNMSVWLLDTLGGGDPVSKLDVWPQAAGYSDFAQARSGAMLLLYEAGGTVYDYGIKISPVDVGRGRVRA